MHEDDDGIPAQSPRKLGNRWAAELAAGRRRDRVNRIACWQGIRAEGWRWRILVRFMLERRAFEEPPCFPD